MEIAVLLILAIPLLIIAWYLLFVRHPVWGCYIVLAEIILGGNGRWIAFLNGTITPRYVLFVALVAGYLLRLLLRSRMPKLMLWQPLLLFVSALIGGTILALVLRNPDPLGEPQVWGYLIFYPMVTELSNRRKFPDTLLNLIVLCTVIMTVAQLAMMAFANVNPGLFYDLYARTPLEDMRITVPQLMGASIYYVFWGNSALQGFVVAIFLLALADHTHIAHTKFSRRFMALSAILCALGMVFSMTRGTWGALAIILICVGGDLIVRRRMPVRIVGLGLTAVLMFGAVVVFVDPVREAFVSRFATLLPENRDELSAADSIVVKAEENELIFTALAQRPILGYGFGEGQYGYIDPVMENRSRFHNWFLGFALKTGYPGLFSLVLLLFCAMVIVMRVGKRVSSQDPFRRAMLVGMVYGLIGTMFASTSNPHMGTPAVIATIALMCAFAEHVHRQLKEQPSIDAIVSAQSTSQPLPEAEKEWAKPTAIA